MTTTMDYGGLRRRDDPTEFNLREWDSQANRITRRSTNSRRFSASNINSFREDITRQSSFRSNVTISSTASSPGYPLIKDKIDPSTYSFTDALKALQAKSVFYTHLECLSPEGYSLHSKWNDAEKYISNPHSGRVPMECLSARSFRNLKNRMTMSAPLVYNFNQMKLPSLTLPESDLIRNITMEEEKIKLVPTRDIGIQIGSHVGLSSSSSLSPASTPSIQDRATKRYVTEGVESSSSNPVSEFELEMKQEKETHEEEEDESSEKKQFEKQNSDHRKHICRCGSCLPWAWMMIVRKHKR